jgi:hypothetical protein
MRDLEHLFIHLQKSRFRSRFHLRPSDFAYLKKQGGQTIRQHAQQFVASRLSAAEIAMMVNKRLTGATRYSLPNMPLPAVAEVVCKNGMALRQDDL